MKKWFTIELPTFASLEYSCHARRRTTGSKGVRLQSLTKFLEYLNFVFSRFVSRSKERNFPI